MNALIEKIKSTQAEINSWMEYMHRHPELTMEEHETAKFIGETIKPCCKI